MIVTQRHLFARSNRSAVDGIIAEQARMIDAALQTANDSGFSRIEHELPSTFQLNNLDKADAQLLVYSELLSLYRRSEREGGRGFDDVTITIGPRSYLHISWMNGMDDDEREMRRQIIFESVRPPKPRPASARVSVKPKKVTPPRKPNSGWA